MPALEFTVENNIATLLLNRPEAKNALNAEISDGLEAALLQISADRAIRVDTTALSPERAAEHIVANGSSDGFDARWRESEGGAELRRVRNIKPGFRHDRWWGLANAALETLTGGARDGPTARPAFPAPS